MNYKRFYWLAQLIGWISYCGLVTLSIYNRSPEQINSIFLLNIFVVIVIGILGTHVQRIIFIRLGWLGLRLPKLLPRLLFASVLCSVFISGVDQATDYLSNVGELQKEPFSLLRLIVSFLSVLVLVIFWNAIYFTFHFFQQSRKQEISNLELKASNRESELKNLRSQLNPHFLFNSLNSIRALVDIEPSKAKISITTLSNLLRQSLLLGKENQVSLDSEMDLAKSYLELEKIRFEERLNVEWELSPGLEHFEIPPFTLQMMVENAIKHGISNLKEGGVVKIFAIDTPEAVVITVTNTGNLDGVVDLGVGIQNIKQRLALQYENGAEFSLKEKDGLVIAKMKFKK
ncbi:MAG: histidine kinase [Crocinitomicaceae bacterium]|nr:histidine kinase [Crocinitomicaceae bacterium]